MNNSVVFRLNYLLGVNKTILEKEFPIEFKESEKLKLFENYPDARKVRSICRLRQSVLTDFSVYQRKQQDVNAFNGVVGINEDISYLKSVGIDIKSVYKDLSLFRYFNFLGRILNIILFKVMIELEMPYVDELIRYFYMPIVSKSELETLSERANDANNPYKIVIYEGNKIKQSLKYALHKDRNCIFSIYSMQGKSFVGDMTLESFSFSKEPCDDIDPDAVIDVEKIFKEVKAEMVTSGMKPMPIRGLEEFKKTLDSKNVDIQSTSEGIEQGISSTGVSENNEVALIQDKVTDNNVENNVKDCKEEIKETAAPIYTNVAEKKDDNSPNIESDFSEIMDNSELCIMKIIKTVKINSQSVSIDEILYESRYDALTYFVLCSIIKMSLNEILNLEKLKNKLSSLLAGQNIISDMDIDALINKMFSQFHIEYIENKAHICIGNYEVSFG